VTAPTGVSAPPYESPPPVRGRRLARLDQRRRRWRLVALTVVVALVAAGVAAVFLLKDRSTPTPTPAALVPDVAGPAPSSVVWSLLWDNGRGASVAVVGVPAGAPAIAVVAGDTTAVDLPAGAPLTVGPASATASTAVETAQALLNRRVGHYLISTPEQVAALAGRLGSISFDAQGSVIAGGGAVGPGQTTATGPQVLAYLTRGTGADRWTRWQEVLSGILDAPARPSAWTTVPGTSDDGSTTVTLLRAAHGASVVDLPTTGAPDAMRVDVQGVDALVHTSFGASVGQLVRVIVQNGNGTPGTGARIGAILAPSGFRVVASQNASSFGIRDTKIAAADGSFVQWANAAHALLGVGRVVVDERPTGIADITIIVGKDFQTG
jgi:LytR cell envelope-related transcriptional attenuator